MPARFGLVRVRSPLLTESLLLSLPPGTEMFQFPGLATLSLWIQLRCIRGSRDQRLFDGFPGLIAVFHALPRLLAPRHPPHALSSLAALIPPSNPCTTRDEAGIAPSYQAHDPGKGGGPRVTILFSLKAHAEFARNGHAVSGRSPHGVARESQLLPLPNCQRTTRLI